MSLRRTVHPAFALACSLLLLVGCERSPTASNPSPVALHVSAASISANVSMVVIKVTAADIPVPLVFNFPVSGGAISGTITVPAGSSRTITASAYDVGNTETHRGVVTMNLPAGTQPTLELKLLPLTSDQPINITVTSVVVTVSPPTLTLTVGAANGQLTATIKDGDGNSVAGTVKWATTDPSIATVDANGSVHATGAGTVQIVATFAGVASASTITVFTGTSATLIQISNALSDPVYVTTPPGDDRLFVVERAGRVRVIKNNQLLPTAFLDIRSKVYSSTESGMLSIAFHPNYAQNHFFYVLYTLQSGGVVERIARFTASSDPDVADAASEFAVLSTPPRATDFHNGGLLQFGPDNKLYVAFGDGGTSANAQNLNSLHGKMLRIDVDGGSPYSIPIDNPFVGQANVRQEIYHYGFRNPWRYSFDPLTKDLYIADVGESSFEEVDVQLAGTPSGKNYGWPIMEGASCYLATTCNQTGLTLPIFSYPHQNFACSILGGYVYRGNGIQELSGHYLYADYCDGTIKSFKYVNGQVTSQHDWSAQVGAPILQPTSFGRDWRGELYIMGLGTTTGTLYKFVPHS